VPRGHFGGSTGLSIVNNAFASAEGRGGFDRLGIDTNARLGLTDHMDLGFAPFQLSGLRADFKYNVLPRSARLAVAPHLGAGYAVWNEVSVLQGGLYANYRILPQVDPYIGIGYSDYFVGDYLADYSDPKHPIAHSGAGDGVLEATLGFALFGSPSSESRTRFLIEVTHWFLLNDDPGDHYAFLPNTILGLGIQY
jgi:hypothetical protein